MHYKCSFQDLIDATTYLSLNREIREIENIKHVQLKCLWIVAKRNFETWPIKATLLKPLKLDSSKSFEKCLSGENWRAEQPAFLY